MPDKYAGWAVKSLHNLGFGVRADVQAKRKKQNGQGTEWNNPDLLAERGRADLMVCKGGRSCYIEIKTGDDSFPFGLWKPHQRDWWRKYCQPEPYSMDLWLWITMGVDPPNYSPEKFKPRKTWLLPAEDFLRVEAVVSPIQLSLPYRVEKGYRTELQERQLDALHLWATWELNWAGKGVWAIPESHVFHRAYISPARLSLSTAA